MLRTKERNECLYSLYEYSINEVQNFIQIESKAGRILLKMEK